MASTGSQGGGVVRGTTTATAVAVAAPESIPSLFLHDVHDRAHFVRLLLLFVVLVAAPLALVYRSALYTDRFEYEGFLLLLALATFHFAVVFYDTYLRHWSNYFHGALESPHRTIHLIVALLTYLSAFAIVFGLFMSNLGIATDTATSASDIQTSSAADSATREVYANYLSLEYLLGILFAALFAWTLYVYYFAQDAAAAGSGGKAELRALRDLVGYEATVLFNGPPLFCLLLVLFVATYLLAPSETTLAIRAALCSGLGYLLLLYTLYFLVARFAMWGKYFFTGKVLFECLLGCVYAGVLAQLAATVDVFAQLETFFQKRLAEREDSVRADSQTRFYRRLFFLETLRFKDAHPIAFDQIYHNWYESRKKSDDLDPRLVDIDRQKFFFLKLLLYAMLLHLFMHYPVNNLSLADLAAARATVDAAAASVPAAPHFCRLVTANVYLAFLVVFAAGVLGNAAFTYTSFSFTFLAVYAVACGVETAVLHSGLLPPTTTPAAAAGSASASASTTSFIPGLLAAATPSQCLAALLLPLLLTLVATFDDLPSSLLCALPVEPGYVSRFIALLATLFALSAAYAAVGASSATRKALRATGLDTDVAVHYALYLLGFLIVLELLYHNHLLSTSLCAAVADTTLCARAYDDVVVRGADHLFKQAVAAEAPLPDKTPHAPPSGVGWGW